MTICIFNPMGFIKRALILFLSVCLFSASLPPCADDFPAGAEKTSVAAKTCDEQGPEAGECSPFCVCNCCSVVRSHPPHISELALYLPAFELKPGHLGRNPSSHHSSIWQPPRMG